MDRSPFAASLGQHLPPAVPQQHPHVPRLVLCGELSLQVVRHCLHQYMTYVYVCMERGLGMSAEISYHPPSCCIHGFKSKAPVTSSRHWS